MDVVEKQLFAKADEDACSDDGSQVEVRCEATAAAARAPRLRGDVTAPSRKKAGGGMLRSALTVRACLRACT